MSDVDAIKLLGKAEALEEAAKILLNRARACREEAAKLMCNLPTEEQKCINVRFNDVKQLNIETNTSPKETISK